MHILDLIVFIILTWVVTGIISFLDDIMDWGEIATGVLIALWVVIYTIIFVVYDNNWIDIFENIQL
jgi:hypothetical protein